MGSIFVIEDEHLLANSIAQYMKKRGHQVWVFASGEEGIKAYRENPPDVVILDYRLPGKDGLEVLKELKEIDPAPSVIIITAYGTVETAVDAMKTGAYDYIPKPLDLLKLQNMVDKLFENIKLQQEVVYHRGRAVESMEPQGIIGESPAVKKTIERLQSLVKYDDQQDGGPTVLICGETGTGKEVFARALHRMGARAEKPFIEINCTAIPESLMEAELFGYRKGSFTDAKASKAGLIEAAEGGTLFLDEIGHLGLGIQAKMLKVLEEKCVRRIGDINDRHINVKIIAATNRDLDAAREQGTFREDLYHRLNVIRIDLPPLRERGEDVLLLTNYFLDLYNKKYGKSIKGFTEEAKETMMNYPWPGNVRELNNVIERAILLEDVEKLGTANLGIKSKQEARSSQPSDSTGAQAIATDSGKKDGFTLPPEGLVLEDLERKLITDALHRTRWNRSMAARLLGISLDTLRYRIKKHEIES